MPTNDYLVNNLMRVGEHVKANSQLLEQALKEGLDTYPYLHYAHLVSNKVMQALTDLEKEGIPCWRDCNFGELTEIQGLNYIKYVYNGEPRTPYLAKTLCRVPIEIREHYEAFADESCGVIDECLIEDTNYDILAIKRYKELHNYYNLKEYHKPLLRGILRFYSRIIFADRFFNNLYYYLENVTVDQIAQAITQLSKEDNLHLIRFDNLKYIKTSYGAVVNNQFEDEGGRYAVLTSLLEYYGVMQVYYGEYISIKEIHDILQGAKPTIATRLLAQSNLSIEEVVYKSIEALCYARIHPEPHMIYMICELVLDNIFILDYLHSYDDLPIMLNLGLPYNEISHLVKEWLNLNKDIKCQPLHYIYDDYFEKEGITLQ